MIVRKSADELTKRGQELNTSRHLIIVSHIEPERWSPPVVDAAWYAFCQALYKNMEGEDWEEMYDLYKVMSRSVGVKQPHKAKAL